MRTRLHFHNDLGQLARLAPSPTTIVIYDRRLLSASSEFKKWIRRYPNAFSVTAGEHLKSLSSFSKICELIHKKVGENVTRDWCVLAVGGGSIGDFAGFFASVYRRGLRLIHVPSTWLSAIDSSHGGKTALNLGGAKNQIGTFYPADDTILVRSLLRSLPSASVADGMGELAKIAIIDGHGWIRKLKPPADGELLWRTLKPAISSKNRVVNRDPNEIKGTRQILNLGHTMGHVFESELGLSHGRSVGLGLHFAIDMSEAEKTLTATKANKFRAWLEALRVTRDLPRSSRVSKVRAAKLLRTDKKRDAGDFVWFILVRDFGRTERRKIKVSQILQVASRYGWLK